MKTDRTFTVTYVGQIATTYTTGQKLSFKERDTDQTIASKVNMNSGLKFIDLGFTGKNEAGEMCFAQRMDGRNFGNILRIKEDEIQ
jgi:hypothetical protein